jgi:hypothetical protein
MIHPASQVTSTATNTGRWVAECTNNDASPFLKLAVVLIVVFCVVGRFLGGPIVSGPAVGALGLFYSIGVVALTLRTYRQS